MPENTQEQKLDYALEQLDTNLLLWGIDNWLGYRTAETMKLSVAGATNLDRCTCKHFEQSDSTLGNGDIGNGEH
jgi:hypothetical protein